MSDSSPPNPPNVAGKKRSLPASEPAPALSPKRQRLSPDLTTTEDVNRAPMPVSSRSIRIQPSSLPPIPQQRTAPHRSTRSTRASLRAWLTPIPSITLPANGLEILVGRSGSACHVKLSSNPLVSRVHIKARYYAATERNKARIHIECIGINGAMVYSLGGRYQLPRDCIFITNVAGAKILLNIHGSRIYIRWPHRETGYTSEHRLDASPSLDPPSGPSTGANGSPLDFEELQRRNERVKLVPVSPVTRCNINQLPISRINAALAATVTGDRRNENLLDTICYGEMRRVGKAAAEIQNSKKSNKQYYWKKPQRLSDQVFPIGNLVLS